jgi:WD40 repeat protein/serine/threonine protein kinase
MGIVFRARQVSLNRIVALKTIRPSCFGDRTTIQRFRNEAQSAAGLQHPNLVPIFEFGHIDGIDFFTMEFINGPSLANLIRDQPLSPTVASEYAMIVARAIAYAHRRGIVHRDLKPSNVLIDTSGQPRVTDFGIARPINTDSSLTNAGQAVGTPSFMSPEQSLAIQDIDPKLSDIYSLGALMYALLTGRPPFSAATEIDTLIQVRTADPVAPSVLNPGIPHDLEVICGKCLRKIPPNRYATADELADDLERFLAGKPITARHVRKTERLWSWCWRNRMVSALLLVSVAFALCTITVLTVATIRMNHANNALRRINQDLQDSQTRLKDSLQKSERFQRVAQEQLYVADMKEAGQAWHDGDVRQLALLQERQKPTPGNQSYHGGEWHFLQHHSRVSGTDIAESDSPVYFVCYAPDSKSIATAGIDAAIRVYNAATHELRMMIPTGQIEVNGLAFSSDGMQLASAGDDGYVRVWAVDWRAATMRATTRFHAHEPRATNVLFAQNDELLISAGHDAVVRLWDPQTGRQLARLEGHRAAAGAIALHPNGNLLASASSDGDMIIWDLTSRSSVHRIRANSGRLLSVAFSPDGKLVAATSMDRRIQIWHTETWELVHQFEHLDGVQRVVFTPDSKKVMASDFSGMVRIWALSNDGSPSRSFSSLEGMQGWRAHRDRIYGLVLAADGHELLTCGNDGRVSAWDLRLAKQNRDSVKLGTDVQDMAFVSGGKHIATTDGRTLTLWDPTSSDRIELNTQMRSPIESLAASADGSVVAAGGNDGRIHAHDIAEKGSTASWNLYEGFAVHQLALSTDGTKLAAVNRYGSHEAADDLYVVDLRTGSRIDNIRARRCNSAAFLQNGRWLVASSDRNTVTVWDMESEEIVAERPGHVSSINCIESDPLGQTFATASDDRLIKIWSRQTWEPEFVLSGHRGAVTALAYTSDGRTIASVTESGGLTLWHSATGQVLFDIDFEPAYPIQIEFSPDDRFLACLVHNPTTPDDSRYVQLLDWRNHARAHEMRANMGRP